MPDVRLDHCVITVSDWERSNAFYRDVLGAELVPGGGGWMYRFGDAQLNLHGPGGEYEPNAAVPGTVEAAAEHLRGNGVEVELGPVERIGARGAGTSDYFRDPDGSLLEFISYGDAR